MKGEGRRTEWVSMLMAYSQPMAVVSLKRSSLVSGSQIGASWTCSASLSVKVWMVSSLASGPITPRNSESNAMKSAALIWFKHSEKGELSTAAS